MYVNFDGHMILKGVFLSGHRRGEAEEVQTRNVSVGNRTHVMAFPPRPGNCSSYHKVSVFTLKYGSMNLI